MALISCPVCGRQISEFAAACPHCGARLLALPPTSAGSPDHWDGTASVLPLIGAILGGFAFCVGVWMYLQDRSYPALWVFWFYFLVVSLGLAANLAGYFCRFRSLLLAAVVMYVLAFVGAVIFYPLASVLPALAAVPVGIFLLLSVLRGRGTKITVKDVM